METKKIKNLVLSLGDKPSYVNEECVEVDVDDNEVDVILFGDFHHHIHFGEDDFNDTASCVEGCAYSKKDLLYSFAILEAREEILKILGK